MGLMRILPSRRRSTGEGRAWAPWCSWRPGSRCRLRRSDRRRSWSSRWGSGWRPPTARRRRCGTRAGPDDQQGRTRRALVADRVQGPDLHDVGAGVVEPVQTRPRLLGGQDEEPVQPDLVADHADVVGGFRPGDGQPFGVHPGHAQPPDRGGWVLVPPGLARGRHRARCRSVRPGPERRGLRGPRRARRHRSGRPPSSGEVTATTEAMLGRAVCRSQRADDWRSAGEPAVVGIR